MTNNNNKTTLSPKDAVICKHKEYQLNMAILASTELNSKRPGDFFELLPHEESVLRWESYQHFAWTKGLAAGLAVGMAGTLVTRQGLTLASRYWNVHAVVKEYAAVPSVGLGTFVGKAVAVWNRDETKAQLEAVRKIPLLPGTSPTMDEYCPLLLHTYFSARRGHPDGALLTLEPETHLGKMMKAASASCFERLAYQKVLKRENKGVAVPIPKPGVPHMDAIKEMLTDEPSEEGENEEFIFRQLIDEYWPDLFVTDQEDDATINK